MKNCGISRKNAIYPLTKQDNNYIILAIVVTGAAILTSLEKDK